MLYPFFIGVSLIDGKPYFVVSLKKSLASPYGFLDDTNVSKEMVLLFVTLCLIDTN